MMGWAILGIATVFVPLAVIAWWCYSDARRSRAHRRLALVTPAAEPGTAKTERSVAAIMARVKHERHSSVAAWPRRDPDEPATPAAQGRTGSLTVGTARGPHGGGVSVPLQRVAARQRPYINPSPTPRHQPLPAPSPVPSHSLPLPPTTPPTLALLRRIRDGLEHL